MMPASGRTRRSCTESGAAAARKQNGGTAATVQTSRSRVGASALWSRAAVRGILSGGVFLGLLCHSMDVHAEPPDLKTPAPVIYLAENLDEKDGLGYCIDTVGRGFGERLHAHSCKPRGGDVQFAYDAASRRILSATFSGKCATLMAPAVAGVSLGLVDCSTESAEQAFDYDSDAMVFRPGGDRALCLAVGATSRSAGPFMALDLLVVPCRSTDAKYTQWRIRDGPR